MSSDNRDSLIASLGLISRVIILSGMTQWVGKAAY